LKGPDLAPHVYDELRRLAAAQMRAQAAGHTLQPTALVSEAWMKLAANPDLLFEDRRAYLVLASRAMRQILIDHARGKGSQKRGGQWKRLTLAELDAPGSELDVDLLALEDALAELERLSPDRVRLVELRFFGGLTETEASEALGISRREASRQWRAARAFLKTRLEAGDPPGN
jgi:RNA polymerase sigma factor (TIGR02999 family)